VPKALGLKGGRDVGKKDLWLQAHIASCDVSGKELREVSPPSLPPSFRASFVASHFIPKTLFDGSPQLTHWLGRAALYSSGRARGRVGGREGGREGGKEGGKEGGQGDLTSSFLIATQVCFPSDRRACLPEKQRTHRPPRRPRPGTCPPSLPPSLHSSS